MSRPTLGTMRSFTDTGLSPTMADLSKSFSLLLNDHWPGPRSLVTTKGVSVISFPPDTEMFQFPALAPTTYEFSC